MQKDYNENHLKKYAARSNNTKGRIYKEKENLIRSPYQRDRDRIIHSSSFRRLKHKTQVFVNIEGDHYRTRLTHSMEVSQIARTLATNPKFVLLDEPFAGVDPIAVEDIQKIIAHLKKKNIGVLITDHNVQETLAITDKTYLMFEGNILKEGIPEVLAKDEVVRKVYLGQNFELRKKKIDF